MNRPHAGSRIMVGTSGWSYQDWRGVVYPADRPGRFDELAYLAEFFDAVEVNSSFYRPPPARYAASWLRRTADRPAFQFTFKLWQRFTHERDERWSEAEADAFRAGVDPIARAGRLGAVLIQFPWSFRFIPRNVDWLADVSRTFRDWPLVAEVRHATWGGEGGLEALRQLGLSFCNIDQPQTGNAIPPAAFVTGPVGYVRLHGRNEAAWFNQDAGRDERYNYLYSDEELADWIGRVTALAGQTDRVYVFTNNHYRGQAPANALQIMAKLKGERVRVPAALAAAYPFLERIAAEPGPQAPRDTLF